MRGNFPDYAKRFLAKTGQSLSALVKDGKDNETIKMAFFKAGLRRPSNRYLEWFRKESGDKKILGNFISDEFRKFLQAELGMADVTDAAILDSIILLGFRGMTAGGGSEVSVGEMLKALELKDKYRGATPENISEKVKAIFAGRQKETQVSSGSAQKKPEEKKEPQVPEAKKEILPPVEDAFNL